MSRFADVAAIVVGIVFIVAGASKLAVGDGWRRQAAELGAPSFSVTPLPWLELAVGAALVVHLGKPVPAVLAIALLIAFSALLIARLREGRRPPCACFGAWSASPIGARHLVRNGVLTVLAVVALWA